MSKLDKLYEKVCKPNPKAFPNENEASVRFIKNKFIFTVHIALIALQVTSFPFVGIKSGVTILRFITGLTMLGMFLLFCRTRPLVSQLLNAIIINLATFKISTILPEGAYYGLAVAHAAPCSVFYLTQNIVLTGMTGFVQIMIVLTGYKKNLIQALTFSDPDMFADKLVSSFISITGPVLLLYLFVIYTSNQKTDELSKANRKTEEALEHQKIFLYSFSHEMRNPMNSLLGNLDLVLMGEVAPDVREMIGTAKVCGVLLLNLINTVLDAGKLGLGKLEVHPTSTKVHDVFQKVWGISHDLITKKGLKSHLKISRTVPPKLILDSHRLNQVLMNLIGNAVKFTENGSIMLAVSWISEAVGVSDKCFEPLPYDDENEGLFEKEYNLYAIKRAQNPNQSLILSGPVKEFGLEGVSQPLAELKGVLKIIIKDTGCGMTKEELLKLFQKFSQVGQVTVKRQIGTGLGLFISKEIVENMGGEIRAYSKPKVGSTFVICIPTVAIPMQMQSMQQISVNDHLIPKLRSRKFTTIIADDSAFNVSLVNNFYMKIGVGVLATANNGKVAFEKYLEVIGRTHIDIVTLDIDMPLMNGKEVCEKIRQYEKQNSLKRSFVILISGNYEEKDMYNLLLNKERGDMQADCFLKKPLVFEELCWALYQYASISGDRRSFS